MNQPVINIEKLKFFSMAAWFIATLLVIICFRFIKAGIGYLLMKLYQLFVQRNMLML
jgi:hypothetical protein